MPKDRIGGHIDFVVTEGGRPGPTSTFIELEDAAGHAAEVGEWVERREGEWALRIPYAGLEQILADLYDSEINASLSWFGMVGSTLRLATNSTATLLTIN
jgi:hypothetical protein